MLFSGRSMAILAVTAGLSAACLGACTDDSEIEDSPSPTATAIPATPTPVPALEGEYKTTAFAIAPSGVGFDLDNNGTLDNNLPVVFETLNTQLYAGIYDAIFTANGGNASQAQVLTNQIWASLESAGLVLDVDDLNANLSTAINSEALIYLETLTGSPSNATLDWYNGLKNGSGQYLTDNSVGSQTGAVNLATGKGSVGPGSFTYQVGGTLSLEVSNTLATFDYSLTGSTTSLAGGLLGGAVLITEIETLLRDAIPNNDQINEDELVAAALEAIAPLMDLTINGTQAFSVAFTFSASGVDIGNFDATP